MHALLQAVLAALLVPPVPAQTQDAIEFGWGDVFALEPARLRGTLVLALGHEDVGADLVALGRPHKFGFGYALQGGGHAPVHFMLQASGPVVVEGIEYRTMIAVGADAGGNPRWNQWDAMVHVMRPETLPGDVAAYRRRIEKLTLRAPAVPQFVVAHGFAQSDLRAGSFQDPAGGTHVFDVLEERFVNQETLFAVDLFDPAQLSYFNSHFTPQGVSGIGWSAADDNSYDPPGGDLRRRSLRMFWNQAIDQHAFVGGGLDLGGGAQGLDLSVPGAAVSFSIAGFVNEPQNAPRFFVALEDVHTGGGASGNESHLQIDIGEILPTEQQVTIPVWRFQQANPALDATRLARLKLAARDSAVPGAGWCRSGTVSIYDVRVVRASPERLTPQNVFWSNDPVAHAQPSPAAPLSDRFLDQPTTTYKWFAGVGGPSLGAVDDVLAGVQAARDAGVTPHVVLELWPGGAVTDVLAAIAGGQYDAFFRALFQGCNAIGGRVDFAPLHEANGWWYPWQAFDDPAALKAAFERIALLRLIERAHGVALGYVVITIPGNADVLRVAVEGFPGDDAVDFIGLQGFESGNSINTVTFNELFTTSAAVLRRASDLPIQVSEYGFYTVPGAQHEKGLLGTFAAGDLADGRTPVPLVNAIYFNVAKVEGGAWRDWRYYLDDTGLPVPEMNAWIAGLETLVARPELATEGRGRGAYEDALRAHTRLVFRLQ